MGGGGGGGGGGGSTASAFQSNVANAWGPPRQMMCWWPGQHEEHIFEVTREEVVHKRYLTLYDRRIRFPAHQHKQVRRH